MLVLVRDKTLTAMFGCNSTGSVFGVLGKIKRFLTPNCLKMYILVYLYNNIIRMIPPVIN